MINTGRILLFGTPLGEDLPGNLQNSRIRRPEGEGPGEVTVGERFTAPAVVEPCKVGVSGSEIWLPGEDLTIPLLSIYVVARTGLQIAQRKQGAKIGMTRKRGHEQAPSTFFVTFSQPLLAQGKLDTAVVRDEAMGSLKFAFAEGEIPSGMPKG
jgi:hypothetical protein